MYGYADLDTYVYVRRCVHGSKYDIYVAVTYLSTDTDISKLI